MQPTLNPDPADWHDPERLPALAGRTRSIRPIQQPVLANKGLVGGDLILDLAEDGPGQHPLRHLPLSSTLTLICARVAKSPDRKGLLDRSGLQLI